MNFERGKDPKEALGIGMDTMLKEIGGVIVRREDFFRMPGKLTPERLKSEARDKYYECGVMISIHKGKYKIIKNKYGQHGDEGLESELPKAIKEIYEIAKNWSDWDSLIFPTVKNISATLVTHDLVSVSPMASPSASLMYLDYKYKSKNIFKKIIYAIRKRLKSKRYSSDRME